MTSEPATVTRWRVTNKESGWVLGTFKTLEEVWHRIGRRYCRRVWRVEEVRKRVRPRGPGTT